MVVSGAQPAARSAHRDCWGACRRQRALCLASFRAPQHQGGAAAGTTSGSSSTTSPHHQTGQVWGRRHHGRPRPCPGGVPSAVPIAHQSAAAGAVGSSVPGPPPLGVVVADLQERLSRLAPAHAAVDGVGPDLGAASLLPASLGPWLMSHQLQVWGAEAVVACAVLAVVTAVQQRPRGWVRGDLVECRDAGVAGRGLFAKVPIQEGTVLGSYPGRPRSAPEMAAKLLYAPMARQYVFQTDDGGYLDPTDEAGSPSPNPAPGLPFWLLSSDYSAALAFCNEPMAGSGGPNCAVRSGAGDLELLFVTVGDLQAGAEVLIDYGRSYDRSGYSR